MERTVESVEQELKTEHDLYLRAGVWTANDRTSAGKRFGVSRVSPGRGKDPEYSALNKSISDLEKQLKGNGNTLQAFSDLKEKLLAFFKRQSETSRHS